MTECKRICLIGSTREADRVCLYMRAIEQTAGLSLSIDWMCGRTADSTDEMHTDEDARRIADQVMAAGRQSDLVWWLIPRNGTPSQSFGEWLVLRELGLDCITSGREEDRRRLLYRPNVVNHFEADEDALAFVRSLYL